MPNLHTPQRLEGESWDKYKVRRETSNLVAKAKRTGPKQQPAFASMTADGTTNIKLPDGVSSYWIGQHHCSEARTMRRLAVKAIGVRQYKRNQQRLNRSLIEVGQ